MVRRMGFREKTAFGILAAIILCLIVVFIVGFIADPIAGMITLGIIFAGWLLCWVLNTVFGFFFRGYM